MRIPKPLVYALLGLASATLAFPAAADRGWRGDIRHFDKHDHHRWRGGHWVHTWYRGQMGWWWVVGSSWYFYANPVYPHPDHFRPPMVIVQPRPTVIIRENPPVVVAPQIPNTAPTMPPGLQTSAYWYYCEPSKTYYPYVDSCEAPWKQVPATPAGVSQ